METEIYHTKSGKNVKISVRYSGCGFTVWLDKSLETFADTRAEAEADIRDLVREKNLLPGRAKAKTKNPPMPCKLTADF